MRELEIDELQGQAILLSDYYDERKFYTLSFEAGNVRHAESPGNVRAIKGVGANLPVRDGKVFAAYFSSIRESQDKAPNYRDSLYLCIESKAFALTSGQHTVRLRRGLFVRNFEVLRNDKIRLVISYPWPFYRGAIRELFGDGQGDSLDFFERICKMALTYAK